MTSAGINETKGSYKCNEVRDCFIPFRHHSSSDTNTGVGAEDNVDYDRSAGIQASKVTMTDEELHEALIREELVKAMCERNGWDYFPIDNGDDCDQAREEVKWFLTVEKLMRVAHPWQYNKDGGTVV